MTNTETILARARDVAERRLQRLRADDEFGAFHDSHHVADALNWAETFLRRCGEDWTFGVEHVPAPGGDDCGGLQYLNAGDSYAETLGYDETAGSFLLTSWGDWLEGAEAEYQEESGETRCGNCDEFTPCADDWRETVCEYCGRNVSTGE